jgi:hypothetical protein
MRGFTLVLFVSLVAALSAEAQNADVGCIRFVQPDQRWILRDGMKASPTLARIARELCQTDIIVMVHVDFLNRSIVRGDCSLISSTPIGRYVRIRVNARSQRVIDIVAVLSHELEHAVQIGHARWVRRPEHVLTLQRVLVPIANHSVEAERAEVTTRRELELSGRRTMGR